MKEGTKKGTKSAIKEGVKKATKPGTVKKFFNYQAIAFSPLIFLVWDYYNTGSLLH